MPVFNEVVMPDGNQIYVTHKYVRMSSGRYKRRTDLSGTDFHRSHENGTAGRSADLFCF